MRRKEKRETEDVKGIAEILWMTLRGKECKVKEIQCGFSLKTGAPTEVYAGTLMLRIVR